MSDPMDRGDSGVAGERNGSAPRSGDLAGKAPNINPDVIGTTGRDTADWDLVYASSNESFPASDPPSWSGSASVPADREPPAGEQAAWRVEHQVDPRAEAGAVPAGDETSGSLEQTDEPDTAMPIPPDDARQA